ncbi:LIRP-like isoform X2 [Armigeres subalbatus]|uniref:LIRP-like isoform X2 n=1 Tax=Armigeres subalbatus TaxID=124917 RepID=UPI002ED2D9E2
MSSTTLRVSNHLGLGSTIMRWTFMVLMIGTVVQAADQRFCGKQLVMTLSMLCDEFPDLHYGSKKSVTDYDKDYSSDEWMAMISQDPESIMSTDLMMPHMEQSSQQKVPMWMAMMYPQGYGFRSSATRNDLIPPRFRKSPRGIVDECCLRPCSLNQLLKYCKTVA